MMVRVVCGVVPALFRTEYTYGVLVNSPMSVNVLSVTVLPVTVAILSPASPRRMSYLAPTGPSQRMVNVLDVCAVLRRFDDAPPGCGVAVVGAEDVVLVGVAVVGVLLVLPVTTVSCGVVPPGPRTA